MTRPIFTNGIEDGDLIRQQGNSDTSLLLLEVLQATRSVQAAEEDGPAVQQAARRIGDGDAN